MIAIAPVHLSRASARLAALAFVAGLPPQAAGAQAIFLTAPSSISRMETPRPAASGALMAAPPRPAPPPARAPQTPEPIAQNAAPAPDLAPPMGAAPVPAPPMGAAPVPSPPMGAAPVAPPRAVAPAARPAVAAAPASGQILRHLTNNVQGYRLSGEIGASEWPIYLTDGQARRDHSFQVGYLAAVSVMPEASTLTLMINDEIVGATSIKAVSAVKTVVFDVPPGLLKHGFNSVRLMTELRHRVDCSIEATYELWTQIDPTQTGLLIDAADASIDNLADLGALLPDEQGALPIRAVMSAKPKPSDVERMLRAVQLISIAGRFEQPLVDTGALAAGRYGVNLVVGTASELAREIKLDVLGVVDRPRAIVLPATAERRATIVVTGLTVSQVDEAMKQFLVATTPNGSPEGLRAAAAFPGLRMEGNERVKLSEAGAMSVEFTGRLFRSAFNIIMPPDFYAADYGRASVRLAGGYAPGLSNKSQVVMSVNDRTAVSLNLLKSSGDVFKDNPLPLPLGFLRPGLNRIEIEAHVPNEDDASCDTLAALRAGNRFLFLDATEIEIPAIARVARMPDLAVTATGGFPYAGAARRPKLYLPSFDSKSIGAAATIVAHLAIGAGRPVDFEIVSSPPVKGKGPTLAVAPIDALDPALLTKLDMPGKELRDAWRSQIGAERKSDGEVLSQAEIVARNRLVLQSNFPMACNPPRPAGGFKAALSRIDSGISVAGILRPQRPAATENVEAESGEGATRDLFQEWDNKVRGEGRWSSKVSRWFADAREWGVAKFTDAGGWMRQGFESDAEAPLVTSQSLLAIGQNILGDSSADVWTVVTAPNPDALAEAVGCLVDPRVSRQISGRVSVLDIAEAKVATSPVLTSRFVVTQPLSVGNVRLIAAGWLSLNAFAYVMGAFAIAAVLAVTTLAFVRNVGRRT